MTIFSRHTVGRLRPLGSFSGAYLPGFFNHLPYIRAGAMLAGSSAASGVRVLTAESPPVMITGSSALSREVIDTRHHYREAAYASCDAVGVIRGALLPLQVWPASR